MDFQLNWTKVFLILHAGNKLNEFLVKILVFKNCVFETKKGFRFKIFTHTSDISTSS